MQIHEPQTRQEPCYGSGVSDDLKCTSLLSASSPPAAGALTARAARAVDRTGPVSGFIILSRHLHNARGIKLNLHNSSDYTCYET